MTVAFVIIASLIFSTGNGAETKPRYRFSDINANRWCLYCDGSNALNYVPAKPMESSTGFYDGGTARQVVLNDAAYDEISDLFAKTLKDPNQCLSDRANGTVAVGTSVDDMWSNCILSASSPTAVELAEALQSGITDDLDMPAL